MSGLSPVLNAAMEGTLLQYRHDKLLKELQHGIGAYIDALADPNSEITRITAMRWAGQLHGQAHALGVSTEAEQKMWQQEFDSRKISFAIYGLWHSYGCLPGFHPHESLFSDKECPSSFAHTFPDSYGYCSD